MWIKKILRDKGYSVFLGIAKAVWEHASQGQDSIVESTPRFCFGKE